jgi:hypothetical protein
MVGEIEVISRFVTIIIVSGSVNYLILEGMVAFLTTTVLPPVHLLDLIYFVLNETIVINFKINLISFNHPINLPHSYIKQGVPTP